MRFLFRLERWSIKDAVQMVALMLYADIRRSSASISKVEPSNAWAETLILSLRLTESYTPGMDRQPSSLETVSPISSISGFTSLIGLSLFSETSMTISVDENQLVYPQALFPWRRTLWPAFFSA